MLTLISPTVDKTEKCKQTKKHLNDYKWLTMLCQTRSNELQRFLKKRPI